MSTIEEDKTIVRNLRDLQLIALKKAIASGDDSSSSLQRAIVLNQEKKYALTCECWGWTCFSFYLKNLTDKDPLSFQGSRGWSLTEKEAAMFINGCGSAILVEGNI